MIMLVKIVVEEEDIPIVNACGPQVGHDEQMKHEFWYNIRDFMRMIPKDENVFPGVDFNGHIDREAEDYNSICGGFGFGVMN